MPPARLKRRPRKNATTGVPRKLESEKYTFTDFRGEGEASPQEAPPSSGYIYPVEKFPDNNVPGGAQVRPATPKSAPPAGKNLGKSGHRLTLP
ncbi:MAG: hypothetical protein CMH76_01870 [Nitrospinae bacterium]|nr:hypothetical protein [Nitrospinota bacterium]